MMSTEKFILVSNDLFLDFANTMVKRNGEPFDLLGDFEDFLAWSVAVKLIDKKQAEEFAKEKAIEKQFAEIKRFRDVLRKIARSIIDNKKINDSLIKEINERLKFQNTWAEIHFENEGYKKFIRREYKKPIDILSKIAESVADFLAENKLGDLRICESEDCILFFHDTTKNHSRRWCSMESCGNRAKANAFYKRKKAIINN